MKKTKNGYYKNRHASFLLQYHLVLVTKYRKPVLKADIDEFIKDYFKKYFNNNDCNVIELESNLDHMHVLFEAPVTINLTNLINGLKTVSARMARQRFQTELNKYYWKPYFWSRSYFIATVSDRSTQMVKEYIKNQKD